MGICGALGLSDGSGETDGQREANEDPPRRVRSASSWLLGLWESGRAGLGVWCGFLASWVLASLRLGAPPLFSLHNQYNLL